MNKSLRFKKMPELQDLEGLGINGSQFERGDGMFVRNGFIMKVPGVFRFNTNLEVAEAIEGGYYLIVSQFLTNGPRAFDMEYAFGRIGFKNPEIEIQLRALCDELVSRGLAEWVEE